MIVGYRLRNEKKIATPCQENRSALSPSFLPPLLPHMCSLIYLRAYVVVRALLSPPAERERWGKFVPFPPRPLLPPPYPH